MKVNIGRSTDCDIVLDDPTVSKVHAVIDIQYYDDLSIEDQQSKNGTFINGRKIVKSTLRETDELILGSYKPDMSIILSTVFEKFRASKTDFSREYAEMLQNFKEYQKEKDRLSNPPKGPLIIRLGTALAVGIILVFFPDLIPNDTIRYGMMMSVGLFSILGGFLGTGASERNTKLDMLRLTYEDVLLCPKCKIKLINNGYTFIKGKKRCINEKCNAIY